MTGEEESYEVHVFIPIRFQVQIPCKHARDKAEAMLRARELLMDGDSIETCLNRISCLRWPIKAVEWNEDDPVMYLVDPPEGTEHSTWHGPGFGQLPAPKGVQNDD